MQISDPVADMLTRIRNAGNAGHEFCLIPASNLKKEIGRILEEEGYISSMEVIEEDVQDNLKITIKYRDDKSVISGIKRISKPGLRVYADALNMPKVLGGLGIAIISTSHGVMTDKNARKKNIGGEVLAYVW